MARLIVLDASIVLAYFYEGDAHNAAADVILSSTDRFAASTMTLAEVLVHSARADRLDEHLEQLTALGVTEMPLPPGSAPALARLRASTGLKLPDCCVLHAAITAGADAIATRDAPLRAVAAQYGFATP